MHNPASVLYPPPVYPPIVLITNGSGIANRFTVYAYEHYVDATTTDIVRLTYTNADEFTVVAITFVSTSGASISGYTCRARFSTSASTTYIASLYAIFANTTYAVVYQFKSGGTGNQYNATRTVTFSTTIRNLYISNQYILICIYNIRTSSIVDITVELSSPTLSLLSGSVTYNALTDRRSGPLYIYPAKSGFTILEWGIRYAWSLPTTSSIVIVRESSAVAYSASGSVVVLSDGSPVQVVVPATSNSFAIGIDIPNGTISVPQPPESNSIYPIAGTSTKRGSWQLFNVGLGTYTLTGTYNIYVPYVYALVDTVNLGSYSRRYVNLTRYGGGQGQYSVCKNVEALTPTEAAPGGDWLLWPDGACGVSTVATFLASPRDITLGTSLTVRFTEPVAPGTSFIYIRDNEYVSSGRLPVSVTGISLGENDVVILGGVPYSVQLVKLLNTTVSKPPSQTSITVNLYAYTEQPNLVVPIGYLASIGGVIVGGGYSTYSGQNRLFIDKNDIGKYGTIAVCSIPQSICTVQRNIFENGMQILLTIGGSVQRVDVKIIEPQARYYINPVQNVTNQPAPFHMSFLYVISSLVVTYIIYRRTLERASITFSGIYDAVFFTIFISMGGAYVFLAGLAGAMMSIKIALSIFTK
ncbi:MAG: hypothetical protein QXT13_10575 [Pyrobaculum sp.]